MLLDLLLVFQIITTLLLIVVILLQKTGSDTLSGLSAGGPAVFSGKTSNTLLKKITLILAAAFILNSLMLAKITFQNSNAAKNIAEQIEQEQKDQKKIGNPEAPKIE